MDCSLEGQLAAVDQFRNVLRQQLGRDNADSRLALVRDLILKLPHRYFAAATREEIQAAGRRMIADGRSSQDMRVLQETLVGMLDFAVRAGALARNPLRSPNGAEGERPTVPRAALVVGVEPDYLAAIASLLAPLELEVVSTASTMPALDRVRWFPFAFVLSRFQSSSDQTAEFLAALRGWDSLCGECSVILLAPDSALEHARRHVGHGATRAISLERLERELPPAIAELGAVRDRSRVRLTVRATLADGRRTELWQSEDLSVSGMLVRTRSALAPGAELDLSLQLPNEPRPVVVRAEVARHTQVGSERAAGLGLRFLSFRDDGQRRLELFLSK